MRRERRSAKAIIKELCQEYISRFPDGPEKDTRLMVIETIALRMGWQDLYSKLRWRKSQPKDEKWWQK